MNINQITESDFSPDIFEFIKLLNIYKVRYLVVGGEAVIFYGYPRLTGDIDFYYSTDEENVRILYQALSAFRSGSIPEIESEEELTESGIIFQFGRPPQRIDLLNQIDGIFFEEAWKNRLAVNIKNTNFFVNYISQSDLLKNKRASGRHKDLDDIEHLSA